MNHNATVKTTAVYFSFTQKVDNPMLLTRFWRDWENQIRYVFEPDVYLFIRYGFIYMMIYSSFGK